MWHSARDDVRSSLHQYRLSTVVVPRTPYSLSLLTVYARHWETLGNIGSGVGYGVHNQPSPRLKERSWLHNGGIELCFEITKSVTKVVAGGFRETATTRSARATKIHFRTQPSLAVAVA